MKIIQYWYIVLSELHYHLKLKDVQKAPCILIINLTFPGIVGTVGIGEFVLGIDSYFGDFRIGTNR